jgi:hypothetical protein
MATEGENPPVIYAPHIRRLRGSVVPGLEKMEPAIDFLPPAIADATMHCATCHTDVPVPLKKTFREAPTPVFPNDYDPVTNNKFWQLVTMEVECPKCQSKVLVQPPRRSWTKNVNLYGDEAVREKVTRPFVCITLVGGSSRFIDEVSKKIVLLKQDLEPGRDPTSWRFHMAELHSGQRRQRNPMFMNWSREKLGRAKAAMSEAISEANDSLFVFALVYPLDRGSSIASTKRNAYMAVLCDTIYNFTQLGVSPHYTFDAEKPVGDNRVVIQQWARNAFLGSERQLMYLYLSHGVHVPEPEFVKQGSHICLELSDFVAFVVAREVFCWQNNRQPDYLSSDLGKVYYSWPDATGYARERTIGVPKERIFPAITDNRVCGE